MIEAAAEVSMHTIGGPDGYPRTWGPTTRRIWIGDQARTSVVLDAPGARMYMRVDFSDWEPLEVGWWGGQALLTDVIGMTIGRRPVLFYDRPSDHPTVTSFYLSSEPCVFALLLRSTAKYV